MSVTADRPRGSWGSTPISLEEHETKVRDCLASGLPPDAIDAAVAIGNTLDRQDAAGVRESLRLVGGLTQAVVVY